ncbi:amino acid adenylation domain-containing protein [Calothrix sp. NIES-4071]|nr:amino acid adenylation domain-containing protein [Calothrix sp. NIES-4071]BAZ57647.1 amino acid adenylation domain-containing protein [Calothrix sp. NIES-4105]
MTIATLSGFRLSPHQKHLWLLQKSSSDCITQSRIGIAGDIKPEVLKFVLQQIVSRHDILRTTFHSLPGMKVPVMVVQDSSVFSWREINLKNCIFPKAQIEAISQEERCHKFDFGQSPLLRLALLNLSDEKHILLLTLPALCADTKTHHNLFTEISNLYKAYLNDEQLDQTEVVQYVQFSEWQNQLLEEAQAELGKDYWSQQDFSSLNSLTLNFADRYHQSDQAEFAVASFTLTLPPSLTQKIKQQVQDDVNLFLLSCWQILLWRLTGNTEIIVGSVFDGREYEELNNALGVFAKLLPISCSLTADLRFEEVLEQLYQSTQAASEWQEYFVWETNHKFNFPIIFEFNKLPETSNLSDVSFSFDKIYNHIESFKIKLACAEREASLNLDFDYDTNVFSPEAIQRLAEQFQTLLASVVENPQTIISKLQILPPNQLEELLIHFNQTQVDYSQNNCIHQIFEEQTARTPNQIAVVFEDQQLTYEELNARANQLASYLQKLGVQKEVVVGICIERSLDMIVSILGILKAGGAYLALDHKLPKENIAFRLLDAQVSVLLTHECLLDVLDINSVLKYSVEIVQLDTDWNLIAEESDKNLNCLATANNLAYVVFTSGSTGKPKGVAIEHRQLVNYLNAITDRLELPDNASFATVSTFSADLGNTAIFPALCRGGCLHVISSQRASDPEALAAYCQKHPIDCLKIVPSHLGALLASAHAQSILPRQRLILGGDTASWTLIEKIQSLAPTCLIFNHYGPTEATVGVLTYAVKDIQTQIPTVPLGRPLANTQVYVLDKQMQPVPIGVAGELYIGGSSLARCYQNHPEETAEKFIPNIFSDVPGERLYKTGDLVRYISDGNLEFLGRIDNQVKIRGFRVELGEIEATLLQHPQVRETVVLAWATENNDKRLVAYVVTHQSQVDLKVDLNADELRRFLMAKLPEYMIPLAFVMLKALPLTSNGKIDRQALLVLEETKPESEKTVLLPRTPVEEVLAGLWETILGCKQVGIHDNFFELGGHSLLATQLISRLREAFQIEIPLPWLFETPVLIDLAQRIQTAMSGGIELKAPLIAPTSRIGELPLSFAQQRLWFLDQLEPLSTLYNLPKAVRLQGKLNVEVLSSCINEIIRRHEVLRTKFTIQDGRPIQIISPSINLELPVVDLSHLPYGKREDEIRRLIQEETQRGFDLTQSPLLRATLLQLDQQDYVLLFTLHHIVSDGWSNGVLIREVAALYEAFSNGIDSPLPELPIQYADFALWQQQWLQGEVLETHLAYWQQQLGGSRSALELPTDRPRPAVSTYTGATQSFVVPKTLTDALKALSVQESATLFMTLLAAFKILLYRYSGQDDIIVGSPIANRNHTEIEGLIGFFVNTLVLRTNLAGNPSFKELLQRVREVALGAYTHQDLPFEQLVSLQPERHLSRNPLFDVMFILQNAPMEALQLPGLIITPLESERQTATFDLTLCILETDTGLIGSLEYSTELFDGATIERMIGHFNVLLEGIVVAPDQRISNLPLLTEKEQQQLLRGNKNVVAYQEQCVHQLFEAQVERTPDAIAVVYGNSQLTYRELNQRANKIASYLQKLGVQPEVLVGLCVERSLDLLVGLLGILKAGAAYVPLDPNYPQERLAYMVADAQIPILLTQSTMAPLPVDTQVIYLDTDWQEIDKESQENLISLKDYPTPDNLAYVIYTSGSTGTPKGVLISHRSLVNFATVAAVEYEIKASDRVLQFASISFDAAAEEIFPALLQGATLVLRTEEMLSSVSAFLQQCHQQSVSVLDLPTAFWHEMVAELSTLRLALPESLRLVIIGGERASSERLATWRQQVNSSIRLVNSYGPTETTVVATMCDIGGAVDFGQQIPIGYPIPNVQTFVLDKYLQPVPVGVRGELYIGGVGVARGYLNQPDLTAVKFIPNRFSKDVSKNASRLYKTGDLVRYRPDGNLEFLGRIDRQVKIRGFRIELLEIETVLAQHPEVKAAVVLAPKDERGKERLVAYIVPNCFYEEAAKEIKDELRRWVKEKLPEYMVPGVFILLKAIPLTANGKIDIQALPTYQQKSAFVPPQTTIEKQLTKIWALVLGLQQVSVNDNFFELGGDSILSLQVISKSNQAGLHFTPKQLFQYQTITQLATVVSTTKLVQAEQGLVNGSFPLTPIQHWFFEQDFADPHHWNQAVLLEIPANINPVILETAVQSLIEHHDILRTRFIKEASGWRPVIEHSTKVVLTNLDVSSLSPDEQASAITHLQASLDLSEVPLLRVALINLGNVKRLLFTIHHLLIDGVSWRILLGDLQVAYEQLIQDKAIKLPPKTTSFKQWSYRMQEYAQSTALKQELDYWLTSLRQPVAPLRVDYLGGENTTANARTVEVALSVEETQALLQQVSAAYQTQINDVLLTALVQAFSQWTGEQSLLFDLEGHGREQLFANIDLSRTVGWFTSVFPVRLDFEKASYPGDALKIVKEQLRAIPNRGIGYGILRYLSDVEIAKLLRSLPQAEVSFNYLGQFDQVLTESSLFKLARSSGASQSLRNNRSYLLEIYGGIESGRLQLSWTYSQNLYCQSTIEGLAQGFIEALRELIAHCLSPETGGFTPSDFPLAKLNQEELDSAFEQISFD